MMIYVYVNDDKDILAYFSNGKPHAKDKIASHTSMTPDSITEEVSHSVSFTVWTPGHA